MYAERAVRLDRVAPPTPPAAEEGGLGRLLAMTADDDVNVLATLHFRELFGRAGVYQLAPHGPSDQSIDVPDHAVGVHRTRGDAGEVAGGSFCDGGAVHRGTCGGRFNT